MLARMSSEFVLARMLFLCNYALVNASEKPLTVQEFARLGGHARAKKLGKEKLKESARKAAEARWAKRKAELDQDVKRAKKLTKETRKLAKLAKAREKKRNG